MSDRDKQANVQPRGFTNDGKVSSEIVNDSYGTVDPADSTGLEDEAERDDNARSENSSRSDPHPETTRRHPNERSQKSSSSAR